MQGGLQLGSDVLSLLPQLNPNVNAFQRRFVGEVRRCEDMEKTFSECPATLGEGASSGEQGDLEEYLGHWGHHGVRGSGGRLWGGGEHVCGGKGG